MTLPCVCSLHVYTLSVRIPYMSPPCVCPLCAHSVRMSSHIYVPADLRADVLSVNISSPCLRPLRVHSVHTSPHMYIVSYVSPYVWPFRLCGPLRVYHVCPPLVFLVCTCIISEPIQILHVVKLLRFCSRLSQVLVRLPARLCSNRLIDSRQGGWCTRELSRYLSTVGKDLLVFQ